MIRGFTLMELLVVLTILGLVCSWPCRYSSEIFQALNFGRKPAASPASCKRRAPGPLAEMRK